MQLCTGQDFHWVEPGFLGHVVQAERAELVDDFAATAAAVKVEDFLRGGGQGP